VAAKPDSQDICFVPDGDYAQTVKRLRPEAVRAGDIVHVDGRVLGRHEGVIHFTVGQRKGLGLSGNDEPLFVLKLDAAKARVTVGPRAALSATTIALHNVNWLAPTAEGVALDCAVKVRSMRPPVAARVTPLPGGGAHVVLDHAEDAIAPGQACVFYQGSRVLGGGWIKSAEPAKAVA